MKSELSLRQIYLRFFYSGCAETKQPVIISQLFVIKCCYTLLVIGVRNALTRHQITTNVKILAKLTKNLLALETHLQGTKLRRK